MDRAEEIMWDSNKRYRNGGGLDATRLAKEEAVEVYDLRWAYQAAHPESAVLFELVGDINRDLAQGRRCGVCFAVDDPDCMEGC